LTPTERSRARIPWLLALVALVFGVLGAASVWTGLHLWLGTPVAWMAPVAAADMALMLRIVAVPPGRTRATLATVATAVAIGASLWMVAATTMARLLGLSPLESAERIGPVLVGALLRHGTDGWDVALLAIALPLAWRLAR
jgi:hypothetical protein